MDNLERILEKLEIEIAKVKNNQLPLGMLPYTLEECAQRLRNEIIYNEEVKYEVNN